MLTGALSKAKGGGYLDVVTRSRIMDSMAEQLNALQVQYDARVRPVQELYSSTGRTFKNPAQPINIDTIRERSATLRGLADPLAHLQQETGVDARLGIKPGTRVGNKTYLGLEY